MAFRLKDRQRQIPNGYAYRQPETNWSAPRYASFSTIVQSLMMHRKANPFLAEKHGWRVDEDGVADDVEQYNVRICQQMGWYEYLMGGDGQAVPKTQAQPSLPVRLGNVVGGAEILVDWISSGGEAVGAELAHQRAAVCASCPLNKSGDLLSFFTKPVSEVIRKLQSRRLEWKLETPYDDKLGVCQACQCPLKLKVWMPIGRIKQKLSPEVMSALDKNCWIHKET